MTLELIGHSIRRKLMAIIGLAVFLALFINAVAFVIYEVSRYSDSWIVDLEAQADVVGRACIPALEFDDPKAAAGNLRLLSVRPAILAAALYDQTGKMYAQFRGSNPSVALPGMAEPAGHRIAGTEIELFQPIFDQGHLIGTVYIVARYQLVDRVLGFAAISVLVMLVSLVAALALSLWIQRAFTRPIISIAEIARRILATRDFSLRAAVTTQDEVGYLAGSFNAMLEEVTRSSDALHLADRRKDEFLATLAHELRNPLTPLRNGLDIMRLRRNQGSGAADAVIVRAEQMMDRQVQQISRLVDDLLDVSRISTGKLLLKREIVELQSICTNALDSVTSLLEKRRHTLAVHVPAECVRLDCDPTRLTQVVINLLNNAAKYTPPGGHVALSAEATGGVLRIDVEDDGIGLDEIGQCQIFEMFRQIDTAMDRDQAGLGVGLTLSRVLVELHGGSLTVYSEGNGRGSRFTITLPIVVSGAAGGAS